MEFSEDAHVKAPGRYLHPLGAFLDTSTVPSPKGRGQSAASIGRLRTVSLSRCSINSEQTPSFRPEKTEELISS
jgi:hypothetical protein